MFEAEEDEEDDNCVPAPPIKSPCVSWRPATPPRKRRSGDGASNVEQDKENPAGSGVASASVQVSGLPAHFWDILRFFFRFQEKLSALSSSSPDFSMQRPPRPPLVQSNSHRASFFKSPLE